ncbi:MAG: hypothetical protein KAT71_02000 [Gammaproteobacteria bacterium]|nr:hypothetical protein [Gammaproteobacteria bacterium]
MNWGRELVNAGLVSLAFFVIFVVAELWRKYARPECENTRKFVHFAAGMVCLPFPYWFQSHWTVLFLCIIFFIVMSITKKLHLLPAVHSIERHTHGSIYYPIAIYLTFLISQFYQQPAYYLIAIAVLMVSDSLAALVGKKYGLKLYKIEENQKSAEGSTIFALTTFIIVLLGLLVLTAINRDKAILIASLIAILVTGFELISLNGADNLFIPLGVIAMLIKMDHQSMLFVTQQIGVLLALVCVVHLIAHYIKQLDLSAIIGIALTAYAAYCLVGYLWAVPLILAVIIIPIFDLIIKKYSRASQDNFHIRAIFFVLIVSFIWILIASLIEGYSHIFFVSYVTNISAYLSILWYRKFDFAEIDEGYPKFAMICHKSILFRALCLSLYFTIIPALIISRLDFWFSFLACYVGTVGIESVYRKIAEDKRHSHSVVILIQIIAVISLCVTILLGLISWWYYHG